jgi:iron complex transport system ATP-binding protein
VHIARALAQDTKILLLDEPTANLDVAHQLSILDLVRRLSEQGQAAMAALHDLSLAARYCDRILMLAEKRIVAAGRPEEVITVENLARYFDIRARIERDPSGHLFVLPLGPR